MPTILQILADAVQRLAGPGAVVNASHEVDKATRSFRELDAQLSRVEILPPRAA